MENTKPDEVQIAKNNEDPTKAFMKAQILIETAVSDFEMADGDQDKNKAFKQYSKAVDKLVAIPNPTQEIDDYIFECIVRAKKMKKQIDNPALKSSVVDQALRIVLSEMLPDLKWGDIIGLKPQK
jgi:hypothetical protein